MNETITCCILEDDTPALKLLEKYIAQEDRLELRKCFKSASDAQQFLFENEVDLLIADIHLPDMDAFELIASLPNKPLIILCTGHNNVNYATKGYRLDVVDYLTKPFSYKDFKEAIAKAQKRLNIQLHDNENVSGHTLLQQDGGVVKVYLSDIIYLESVKNYVHIHLTTEDVIKARYSLQQLEDSLPKRHFIRIHKSYMVPKRLIARYNSSSVKLYYLKQPIPLGRTYKASLKEYMNYTLQNKKDIS